MTDYIERPDAGWENADRYTLRAGDSFSGTKRSARDEDIIALRLQADTSYRIEVRDDDGYGAGGQLLRQSTDVITSLDTYTDGSGYRIVHFDDPTKIYLAIDLDGWLGGDYTVTLEKEEDFLYGTTRDLAHELTTGYWLGERVRPAHWDLGSDRELAVDLTSLTEGAQVRARWAMDAWSHHSGITFVESGRDADISFRRGGGDRSFAQRTLEDGDLEHVEITIGRPLIRSAPVFGDDGYTVMLHELGHALGLGHPGPYNVQAVYGEDALYQNDTTLMSVLSYFGPNLDFDHVGLDDWPGNVVTPMSADIRALEMLYGPTQVNGGDTVYDAAAFTSGVFGQTLTPDQATDTGYRGYLLTIEDDGGRDRIDLTDFRGDRYMKKVIDLAPGAVSSLDFYSDLTVRIHDTTILEDLIGSRYGDDVTGNDAANMIRGMKGYDILDGAGGRDRLFGGDGRDRISGGDDRDRLIGGNHDDRLNGGRDDDRLKGGAGQDRLFGAHGDDRLAGGRGDDILSGGRGDDILRGGAGADSFVFKTAMAMDVIRGFQDDLDILDLRDFGFVSRSEARSVASNDDGQVTFDFGNGDILTVFGTTKGDISDSLLV